ncbi:MAG TPA: endonuclease/exonuclease/phosphatase family protein, partial [Candidatus Absconditabacterales bacterium]|nr:endonuclease/exonuclease/phosphatase family protein [Candidatus Absconditabacterales bacterium]
VIFLLFFSYFFPAFYISELILSFTPYIVFFALAGFVLSIIFMRNKKLGYYVTIMPLFVLLFALLFFLFSRNFNKFYNGKGFVNLTGNEQGLDILYSNILYKNLDYTGLAQTISENDPDMVFMVEFTDDHNEKLADVLKSNYPYSARTDWSDRYFGSVVFSKIPINNLTDQAHQGKWRYTYFYTNYEGSDYYIYLMHVSSPVTYHYFEMRNNQFDILAENFEKHNLNRSENDKILMIGDFNVSPWSYYYKDLEDNLIGLRNLTKNFTILFTWSIKYLPFLSSHIDHIFVSDNLTFNNIEKINMPGSDHDGFLLNGVR